MCIPSAQNPAPQPSPVPTMAAASQFDLGNDRGGAQLGRLALRLNSSASSATTNSTQATSTTNTGTTTGGSNIAQPTTPPPASTSGTGSTTGTQSAATGDPIFGASGRGGFQLTPNAALRVSNVAH